MNFILLSSGAISERFLTDARYRNLIKSNLIGLITSCDNLNLLHEFDSQFYNQLPKYQISNKKTNEEQLSDLIINTKPDYVLSIQYPWILSSNILKQMGGYFLNFHNAKLPEYRGHNSISHEIINGETVHTSTLHWMGEEVDRGRIVRTREIDIRSDDTAYSLWSRSVDSALELLGEWFEILRQECTFPIGIPVEVGGFYYKKNIRPFKQIPPQSSLEQIDKWSRAFWFPPHEPAFFQQGIRKLYVLPNNWKYEK